MSTRRMSVGVVGGGIGGLSAALSLLAAGFDVHVYERAPTLAIAAGGEVIAGRVPGAPGAATGR